jgi:glycosyltransferase involved in cell wall biosynthesis
MLMPTSPTVSIIIPVRNRPVLIRRAIETCLAQTRPAEQIVVVDDGSTDDTAAVVEELSATIASLVLVRRPVSGGAAVARNSGAAVATGEYLAFLDSDDEWEPTKLERQMALAAAHPECPGIFCGILYRYAGRAERQLMPPPVVTRRQLEIENTLASTSTGLVRTDAFRAVGGFSEDLPNCEDWELWLKLAAIGPLRVVQELLLHYTFDANNKLSRDAEKLLRGHEMVFARIVASLPAAAPHRWIAAMHELKRAEQHVRVTGDHGRAWRHLAGAVTRYPSLSVMKRALHLGMVDIRHGRRN